MSSDSVTRHWPDLPYAAWKDTCSTLHLWTQIVGKIRLAYTPWLNHSWHVTLYCTARGLTTSLIPYRGRFFEIEFDFHDHRLLLRTSEGTHEEIALKPRTVADFYAAVIAALGKLDISVHVAELPCEFRTPSPSAAIKRTARMIRSTLTASGACWSKWTAC